jgi:hypothetical protein
MHFRINRALNEGFAQSHGHGPGPDRQAQGIAGGNDDIRLSQQSQRHIRGEAVGQLQANSWIQRVSAFPEHPGLGPPGILRNAGLGPPRIGIIGVNVSPGDRAHAGLGQEQQAAPADGTEPENDGGAVMNGRVLAAE